MTNEERKQRILAKNAEMKATNEAEKAAEEA